MAHRAQWVLQTHPSSCLFLIPLVPCTRLTKACTPLECRRNEPPTGTDLITWGPSPTSGELAYGEHTKSSTRAKLVDDLHGCSVVSLACGAFATLVLIDPSVADHVAPLAALPVYAPPAEPAEDAPAAAGAAGAAGMYCARQHRSCKGEWVGVGNRHM
jgi:hypothetical protein